MTSPDAPESAGRPAGYAALIARYGLQVIPNWHTSFVAAKGPHRVESAGGVVRELYTAKYWPGDGLGDQLEFALKYDGINLAILASIFNAADPAELTVYIQSRPNGKYARRIWYLYEWITGDRLPIDDVKGCRYIDLLEPVAYVTTSSPKRSSRQCINDNLLGNARFYLDAKFPYVEVLAEHEKAGRGASIPLRADLVEELRGYLEDLKRRQGGKLPLRTQLFPMPHDMIRIFDRDIAVAEIPKYDERSVQGQASVG